MKRQFIITFLLASFFVLLSLQGQEVFAQGSISGDGVCGAWDPVAKKIVNPCGVDSVKTIIQSIFRTVIAIGLPLLVVFIIYRFVMAWYALQQGNANAYKEAGRKATEAIIGFIIIVAIAGGLTLALLRYIGVNESFLHLLKATSFMEVIPRAYAAESLCAPPKKGDQCFFTANGTRQVGVITDSGSSFDLSLFCKDNITGLTSNIDRVNNTNYWRDQGCEGKTNGTVCDPGTHTMGVCSSSYTPPDTRFTSGAVDCKGKLPDTFCTPTGFSFGMKGGTCVSRTSVPGEATCYPVGTGVRCLSPYNEGKVGTTDIGGTPCIVVGDPCTQSNGKPGVFAQKPQNIFCVDPSTVASAGTSEPTTTTTTAAPVTTTAAKPSTCGFAGLPNPTGFCSLYDFMLGIINTALKFFLYPAMVGVWVWSGFSYVAAQGAPEKLLKAHKLLIMAFVTTLIVFTIQGFLTSVKNSVNNILSVQSTLETGQSNRNV